jgi:DNA primase
MPGVNFERLRAEIAIDGVLDLLGFEPLRRSGAQRYGRCPLPACRQSRRASFSVNVALGRYFCHRCHSQGNALELWAASTQRSLHPAAIDLCHRLGRDVPWTKRW